MMGILSSIVGGVVGLFVRKVTRTDKDSGEEKQVVRPTGFGYGSAGIVSFLLFYYLLFWPWLNYHYPQYGFPPLDLSILGAILPVIGGM